MKKFVLLAAMVVLAAVAWSGAWLLAAGEIEKAVAGLASTGEPGAPTVTCGSLDVGGFPFRFDVTCADAVIASGDLTTTVAGIKASILAYNPTQAKFSALAPIALVDAFSGVRNRIDFAAAEGSARMVTDDLWGGLSGAGWRIGRISFVADEIAWTDTTVGEAILVHTPHLEAHLLDVPERHDAETGTAVLAAYAKLLEAGAPALGIAGGEASLEAELSGVPDDLRAFGAEDLLSRWQALGGRLNLVAISGRAGEEFVEGSGTLALDSGGRLDGRMELTSRGLVERFGTMLPEDWKGLILGSAAADGSYSQVLTIKAGVVFSGIMPVAMIPPLL